jgi:hypothetical protein
MTSPHGYETTGPGLRVTAGLVAAELARITPRDRTLLDLLDQHQTLTTDQITALVFTSAGRARNRLADLHRRGVLDRWRHYQRPGSQAWRWTLGPVGAAILAASHSQPIPRPAAVRDATARLATSPIVAHLLAVNGFFVALTHHARHHPGTRLSRWWNETTCREACANLVRPDGHGLWATPNGQTPFWLEMDLGTEQISRVARKLAGYAALGPHRSYPVLFWLPNTAREDHLHTHLTRTGIPDHLVVATATNDHTASAGGPAGPVWWQVRRPGRLRLSDLPVSGVDGAAWDE